MSTRSKSMKSFNYMKDTISSTQGRKQCNVDYKLDALIQMKLSQMTIAPKLKKKLRVKKKKGGSGSK